MNTNTLVKNDHFLPEFVAYFIKQWAPIVPMISATIIKFVRNQKAFQNNQPAEAHFSNLKNHTMNCPQLGEASLNDFSKRREVWEFDDFIRDCHKKYEFVNFIFLLCYSVYSLQNINRYDQKQYCINYGLKIKKNEAQIQNDNKSDSEDGITLCKSKRHKKAMKKTSWFNLSRKVCLVL